MIVKVFQMMKISERMSKIVSAALLMTLLAACAVLAPHSSATPLPDFVPPQGATGTPLPTATPDPASYVILGPEITVNEASYAFQPVISWNAGGERLPLTQNGPMVSMGNRFSGLYLNLNSEVHGVNHSSADCLEMLRSRMAGSIRDFQADQPEDLIVNNVPGLAVSFSGLLQDQGVKGKIAAFFPNIRCFSLIAFTYGQQAAIQWQEGGQFAYAKLLENLRFLNQLQSAGCKISTDPGYGLTPDNPIRVGNTKISDGLERQERYLKALRGPNFEQITYTRLNPLYNSAGEIVDVYSVSYPGLPEPVNLYFEIFQYEDPQAPIGFNCEGPFDIPAP